MDIGIVKSKRVCNMCPWFVGISHGQIAINRHQIRIGLYWWHVTVTWTTDGKQ